MPNFETTIQPDHTLLAVRGDLNITTASALAEEIDKIIDAKPARVVVDLANLELIDSSGVAALVKLYKGIRSSGSTVRITNAKGQPLEIFKLLRMDKVFEL